MKTAKTRHQFFLPDALSQRLELLADKPGASKTAIMSDALAAWIERGGAAEIDAKFGPRVERLACMQARTDEKLDVLSETLGMLIRHEMMMVAHQPAFSDETRTLGAARYESFTELVGRRLAKRTGLPVDNALAERTS